jgi:hypothetical protein
MLFQLKTGRVTGYDEGQKPLIYIVSSVQAVAVMVIDRLLKSLKAIGPIREALNLNRF